MRKMMLRWNEVKLSVCLEPDESGLYGLINGRADISLYKDEEPYRVGEILFRVFNDAEEDKEGAFINAENLSEFAAETFNNCRGAIEGRIIRGVVLITAINLSREHKDGKVDQLAFEKLVNILDKELLYLCNSVILDEPEDAVRMHEEWGFQCETEELQFMWFWNI
jgi:hypothetical protein